MRKKIVHSFHRGREQLRALKTRKPGVAGRKSVKSIEGSGRRKVLNVRMTDSGISVGAEALPRGGEPQALTDLMVYAGYSRNVARAYADRVVELLVHERRLEDAGMTRGDVILTLGPATRPHLERKLRRPATVETGRRVYPEWQKPLIEE